MTTKRIHEDYKSGRGPGGVSLEQSDSGLYFWMGGFDGRLLRDAGFGGGHAAFRPGLLQGILGLSFALLSSSERGESGSIRNGAIGVEAEAEG